MPPKRSLRKTATSTSSKRATAVNKRSLPTTEQPVCDGCSSAISTEESLQCCHCNAWLHRYCAGMPLRHYPSLTSTPFTCIVCSQRVNEKVQATLHDEISALKVELSEVKAALVVLQQKSSSSAAATMSGTARPSYSETVKTNRIPSHLAARTQRPSAPRKATAVDAKRTSATTPHSQHQRREGSSRSAVKVPVEGARRIWGAYKLCTPAAIQSAITKLTSIKASIRVKRKTKVIPGNKTMWWFVVHGQESVLSALDTEWEKVQLQTKWSLERCFMPSSVTSLELKMHPPCPNK